MTREYAKLNKAVPLPARVKMNKEKCHYLAETSILAEIVLVFKLNKLNNCLEWNNKDFLFFFILLEYLPQFYFRHSDSSIKIQKILTRSLSHVTLGLSCMILPLAFLRYYLLEKALLLTKISKYFSFSNQKVPLFCLDSSIIFIDLRICKSREGEPIQSK